MYFLLWRALPGPRPVKILIVLAVVVAVFFLLMEVIFPLISPLMPFNDVSV